MRTIYIDVYFLINFTVDILSLYFAALLSKVPTTAKRIIVSATVGGISAVIIVLLPEILFLKIILSFVSLSVMAYIAPKGVLTKRKIRFCLSFLIFESLLGAAVSFVWSFFDKYLSAFFSSASGGTVNRKLLVLSLIVLLSIEVFKMLVSFFSNTQSEGSVDIKISFLNNNARLSAFVDSGNLAVDPMDMSPVLLIKKDIAKTFLPQNIIELSNIDMLENKIKKRIRLIPVTRGGSTHVLVGIKADSVKIVKENLEEEIRVTIAIDKEGGSFGGFSALMPSAALDNVVR